MKRRLVRFAQAAGLLLAALGALPSPAGAQEIRLLASKPVQSEFDLEWDAPGSGGPIVIAGARNGAFSGKTVLASKQAIAGVRATVTDLKRSGGGTIPASAVEVRYGLYAKSTDCFDALGATPPAQSPVLSPADFGRTWMGKDSPPAMGLALQPVWVIVNVPADAPAGDYEGRLSVTAGGRAFAAPVKLSVSGWKLPEPQRYRTFVELIQSPESVAMQYGVPFWSERHFALIEKSLELMGRVGSKTVYVPLICETNQGNAESMVRWVKKGSSYGHDVSALEKYLDLVKKHLGADTVVCFYVWDIFLEGTGGEAKKTNLSEERKAYDGKGPPVSVVGPATGKVETVNLPQYSETARSKPLWKPLCDELRRQMRKRGMEQSMALGMITDVQPTPEVMLFFKDLLPGVEWMRRAHGRIQDIAGVKPRIQIVNIFNSTRSWAYNRPERRYGWKRCGDRRNPPGLQVHFPRVFFDHFARCRFRMVGELNIAGDQRGFGGFGADFWPVLKDRRGRSRGNLAQRYPKSTWRNLDIRTSLLAPGPDGAVPTARYQVMREGVQECEARISIEEALLEQRIGGAPAKRFQDILDERVKALTDQMGTDWACSDFHWASKRIAYPKFVESDWRSRAKQLFDAAYEVARVAAPASLRAGR